MVFGLLSQYLPDSIASTLSTIIVLTVVTIGLYILGKILLVPTARKILKQRGVEEHARKPLMKIIWFVVILGSITVGFGAAGLGNFLTALATISAAGTLAIGFAMQNVIKNFVSGVFIFIDQPFKIGDWIEWNGYSGRVEDIDMRVTKVRTFDNELLTVPNGELSDNTVRNPVDASQLRLKPMFGIGYDDDIMNATEIIMDEAEKNEEILDDPDPSVRLVDLGDSSVGLQSRIWIDDPNRADYVKVKSDFVTSVKKRFDDNGIDIPYPHRELTGEVRTQND